ncbi:hypothetical protein H072_11435 [Dactylellina haptotyla CBS 200.50]|uniref:RRM domain-containing protein n=1 Tax=Dactylellina haptotyla (strain CBS 200.50) TaxID=1284197 RepID=S8B862_DACHA|nr:hypothetical protein H072_11435 [Dactylellina haptotyla CBS 200.50]
MSEIQSQDAAGPVAPLPAPAPAPPSAAPSANVEGPPGRRRPLKSRANNNWRNRNHGGHHQNTPVKGWNRWIQEYNQYVFQEANPPYAAECWRATDEGRRLYVGNLDWQTKPGDVALWIEGAGYTLKSVDMPVHPEIPNRPVYCFVEFYSAEDTYAVKMALNGRLMRNRPVRIDLSRSKHQRVSSVGHAEPQQPTDTQQPTDPQQPVNPQSDVPVDISELSLQDDNPQPNSEVQQTPNPHIQESTRLFVGGLPHIENINELEDMMHELFNGFHIESLSNIFSSKRGKFANTENNCYCFIDLANVKDARLAVRFLNNRETSWGVARVNYASGGPDGRLKYRGADNQNQKENQEPEVEAQ